MCNQLGAFCSYQSTELCRYTIDVNECTDCITKETTVFPNCCSQWAWSGLNSWQGVIRCYLATANTVRYFSNMISMSV